MRKVALASSLALILAPVSGHALGLGEIELHSALNQRLDADVELVAQDVGNPGEIKVSIASYEDFEKAGIEREPVLSSLQFRVELHGDGTPYIKIISDKPIREPFLDFLLEVDWPNGHLIREYTVLLDLPVMVDETPAPMEEALSGMAAEEGAAAPTMPSQQATAQPRSPAPAPQVSRPRSLPGEAARNGEIYYGRVQRNDTLWNIADQIRPQDASIPQVMMALLKSNPDAFSGNNINNLRAGYVLRIPDPDMVYEMSRAEAARESRLQYQRWLDAKQRRAGTADVRPVGSEEGSAAAAGGMEQQGARLRLVAPEVQETEQAPAGSTSSGGVLQQEDLAALRSQLQTALEATDISRQENSELRDRIGQLETQLAKMERLLSLRDDTLAVLQQGARQETPASADETAAQQPATPNEPAAAQPAAPQAGDTATPPAVTATPEAEQPAEQATARPAPVPAKPPVKPVPVEEPSMLSNLIATVRGLVPSLNPLVLGGALGGLLLLVLGAVYSRRRRQAAFDEIDELGAEQGDEYELAEEGEETGLSEVDALEGVGDVATVGEPVEINAEIDEIDVIAEADVYIAYHRFDRAEELLRDAIAQEPARTDLKAKLLEVFAESGNSEAFVSEAEQLHALTGGSGAEWSQVAALGAKVAPTHPLFAGSRENGGADSEDDGLVADPDNVADDLSAVELPGADLESNLGGELDDLEMSLDSDVDLEMSPASAEAEGDREEQGLAVDSGGLDEDLDLDAGLDMDLGGSEQPAAGETAIADVGEEAQPSAGHDEMSLDFPLGGEAAETSSLGETPQQEPELPAAPDEEAPQTESAATEAEDDEDNLSNVMDFDTVDIGAGAASDEDTALDELAGMIEEQEQPAADHDQAASDQDTGTAGAMDELEAMLEGAASEEESPLAAEADQASATLDFAPADDEAGQVSPATGTDKDGDNPAAPSLDDDIDWLSATADDSEEDVEDNALFSGDDEVATKLDLARAYIDMGDQDSARSILSEVSQDGNPEQQQEAEQLIQQIG